MRFAIFVLIAVAGIPSIASSEDWSQFRGPNVNGIAAADSYPVEWCENDDIAWSVDLPRGGNGSSIVVENRVFVTSAEDDEGHERSLQLSNRFRSVHCPRQSDAS